ncbi:MAG: acetylornithine transaminase [Actinobacteria bacterium]|nr:acetylornithine transaminase [Actinomycetota bacterium]
MKDYIKDEQNYIMHTYGRLPVVFEKGDGFKLWDIYGKEYLDFASGLGVINIGHIRPEVAKAVCEQAKKLIHVSNLFYTIPQIELAKKLTEISFADKCFFANSGAEANEGAIKLARKYAKIKFKDENRYEIISAYKGFHGRTLAALAATAQPDKQKYFKPMPAGFKYVEYNNSEELKKVVDEKTCAIIIEPIQGEGGVNIGSDDYFKELRSLCDEKKILLIFDEVQTGFGRTGKMFAYEHFGIVPDIMTIAKGLANGMPIGVILAKEEVAEVFEPGDHATTFGGGPLVCSAALATLGVLEKDELVKNSQEVGEYFKNKLFEFQKKFDLIKEVRGKGLMIGVELNKKAAKDIVLKCLDKGLVINNVASDILRFIPPLCISKNEVDTALKILETIFEEEQ